MQFRLTWWVNSRCNCQRSNEPNTASVALVAATTAIRHTEVLGGEITVAGELLWSCDLRVNGSVVGVAGMGQTLELGRRVELLSMDPHCHDISLGLYRQETGGKCGYLIHTYNTHPDAKPRVEAIRKGLVEMAGMVVTGEQSELVAFPCGARHEKAVRRTFLEVCKNPNSEIGDSLPLVRPDKKAACELTIRLEGAGTYRMTAPDGAEMGPRRCQAVARGFAKLCEMVVDESDPVIVSFDCGCDHDELMGSLFFRAQNVRSAMKDDELSAARGTMAVPGNQD